MTPTIATGLAILATAAMLIYIVDRGIANSAEQLGIILIRHAARIRRRRAVIENKQRQELSNASV